MLPTQLGKHFWPNFSIVSGIRIDYLSPTLYVTDLLLILLLGSFVLRWVKLQVNAHGKNQKSKVQFKNKKFLLFIGLTLFFCSNIIFSSSPILSVYGLLKLGECAFFVFYISKTIHYTLQLSTSSLLFVISATFESLLAIFQYLQQGSLNGIFYFLGERTFTGSTPGIANVSISGALLLRPYGTFPHPNVLAAYLLVAMVLVWNFILKNDKRWMQIFGVVSLLVSSIALLLTFSRVVILLWIVCVLFLLGRILFRTIKTWRARIGGLISILLLLAVISMTPIIHELTIRFTQTSLSEESVIERTELLTTSMEMVQQHPVLGVGLYNFIPAIASYQKPLPLGLYLQPVHNIFILVLAETGVIGLALFLWVVIASLIRITRQGKSMKRTYLVLICVIVITGMFDHYWITLQQGQLLLATILGLSWVKLQKS